MSPQVFSGSVACCLWAVYVYVLYVFVFLCACLLSERRVCVSFFAYARPPVCICTVCGVMCGVCICVLVCVRVCLCVSLWWSSYATMWRVAREPSAQLCNCQQT